MPPAPFGKMGQSGLFSAAPKASSIGRTCAARVNVLARGGNSVVSARGGMPEYMKRGAAHHSTLAPVRAARPPQAKAPSQNIVRPVPPFGFPWPLRRQNHNGGSAHVTLRVDADLDDEVAKFWSAHAEEMAAPNQHTVEMHVGEYAHGRKFWGIGRPSKKTDRNIRLWHR
jgi:hypothetical protein